MVPLIFGILLVISAVVLMLASRKPDSFRIERSTTIKAPPEKICPHIVDFRSWSAWSPWEHMDPAMKKTYSGAANGPGAVYEWEGNGKVGKGRMEISDSSTPTKVLIKMHFIKPFEAYNTAEFKLTPLGDSTTVNWAMFGPSQFVNKVMSVFCNLDKMVGSQFEKGLENLKIAAEK